MELLESIQQNISHHQHKQHQQLHQLNHRKLQQQLRHEPNNNQLQQNPRYYLQHRTNKIHQQNQQSCKTHMSP